MLESSSGRSRMRSGEIEQSQRIMSSKECTDGSEPTAAVVPPLERKLKVARRSDTNFREALKSRKHAAITNKGPVIAKPEIPNGDSFVRAHAAHLSINHKAPVTSVPIIQNGLLATPQNGCNSLATHRPSTPPAKRQSSSQALPARSRALSPGFRRRSPSPTDGFDPAVLRRRIQKALTARLYLLHQPGPSSFLVGGDLPEHKYRVMVGPQSCTCGRGPFCVHLLFVMLRVFQLSQTDGMITSRTLKNYEVEALLIAYQARRESQVHAYSARKNVEPPESSGKSQPAFSSGMEGSKSRKKAKRSIRSLTEVKDDAEEKEEEETKEEDVCPICLLEMSEGESLVTCVAGCQNSLHQHCMSIWAEECHRQSEPLVCPLCRFQWSSYQGSTCSVSRVHPDLASLEGTEGQGRSSCDGKCDGDDAVSAGLKPRVDDRCELSRAPSDDISCSCDSGILENLVTKCSIDDRMGSSSSGSGSRATTSLLPASCDPARVSCRIPCIPALSTAEEVPESVCVDDEHKNCRCSTEYLEGVHWIKGKLLGAGAYSSCYHVQDTQTGTLMAVKQLSFCRNAQDDQVKAIREIEWEIATMTQLEHAHVVRVYGASRRAKHFNLFAEWMAGGSVACLLAEYGAFSDAVVTDYVRQVLLGLVYLHDKKILHRDLKGANLLVDSTGQRLKIADFGIAARLAASATAPGEFEKQPVGTWAFMAPEVLRGEDYGRSCDVWAVGCCVIEMSSAQPPWGATDISNHFQLWWKIGNSKTPPPLPDRLCVELKNFAMQCMKMCPKERPAARELVQWPIFVDV